MKRSFCILSSVESLEPRLPLTAATAQEFVVMDFEDSTLHNAAWLDAQPGGTVATYVGTKSDSGTDLLLLAPGQGRNGGNALLVESPDAAAGLPGFWVLRNQASGTGGIANCYDERGYLLPRGARANRLDFWLRFEEGFRALSSSTVYQNINIGTYAYDPAKLGLEKTVESDNWHFYHQLVIRHDQAGASWIHVVINEIPQHQRDRDQYRVPENPTSLAGNYWELLTRFYVDLHPYFGDPEIGYPARMWVDDIRLSYVPEPAAVDVDIEGWFDGQEVGVLQGATVELAVTITNPGTSAISGTVAHRSQYPYSPKLLDAVTRLSVQGTLLNLAPGASRSLLLQFTPRDTIADGVNLLHGVIFVPTTEERPSNASQADANVQLYSNVYGISGPCDAAIPAASVRIVVGPHSNNLRPSALGGQAYYATSATRFTGQVAARDPEGQPLAYTLLQQSAVGGTMVLDPATGAFTFDPAPGFLGSFLFTSQVSDGVNASRAVTSWILVGPETAVRIAINDAAVNEGKLISAGKKKGQPQETPLTFTVSLSRTASQPLTLDYRTVDNTATIADGDYRAARGTLVFAPGELTKSVDVIVLGDNKAEADEAFLVVLENASQGTIVDGLGIGTIRNDDRGKPSSADVDAAFADASLAKVSSSRPSPFARLPLRFPGQAAKPASVPWRSRW
jgi:hypothetical protein